MKTRVAIILMVVALAAVAFVIVRFPGPKRPVSPPAPAPIPKPVVSAATPVEAVVLYIEALYRKDYETAYGCLSDASQGVHPYEEFLGRAETGEAANLDLAAAEVGGPGGGGVHVCEGRRDLAGRVPRGRAVVSLSGGAVSVGFGACDGVREGEGLAASEGS